MGRGGRGREGKRRREEGKWEYRGGVVQSKHVCLFFGDLPGFFRLLFRRIFWWLGGRFLQVCRTRSPATTETEERVREVKGKEEQEAVVLKIRASDTYSCTLRISPEFIYGHNVRFLPSVPVVT